MTLQNNLFCDKSQQQSLTRAQAFYVPTQYTAHDSLTSELFLSTPSPCPFQPFHRNAELLIFFSLVTEITCVSMSSDLCLL